MANSALAIYLNDHLAGAVMALELLSHLEEVRAGTADKHVIASLRADIEVDRKELEAIMGRLDITESAPRKAAAWLTEKLVELKLRLEDPDGNAVRQLEGLETVALGIDGKAALWNALAAVTSTLPELKGIDYARLTLRAEEQRQRIEVLRLQAAQEALATSE